MRLFSKTVEVFTEEHSISSGTEHCNLPVTVVQYLKHRTFF